MENSLLPFAPKDVKELLSVSKTKSSNIVQSILGKMDENLIKTNKS